MGRNIVVSLISEHQHTARQRYIPVGSSSACLIGVRLFGLVAFARTGAAFHLLQRPTGSASLSTNAITS